MAASQALPTTMPAAVYTGPGALDVQDRPVPEPGPGEVLVEVGWCGVCGSDLHMVIEGWGRAGSWGGHEWSGTVAAAGPGVERWAPGDPVVGGPSPTCGECESCRAGRRSLCVERGTPGTERTQGAFARFKLAHEAELMRVPEGLDLRTAALAEPLTVALHAITNSGIERGRRAFVSGAGPIGALVVAALRTKGVEEITVSEPSEPRRELAQRIGATEVVTPEDLDVPSRAEPMRLVDRPHDVAFECSGKAAAMEAALAQLGKGGTLVLVGAGIEPPQFDPNRILLNELVVTGAYEYDDGGFDEALGLLASGALPVDDLLEPDDVPLAGLLETLERLARGEIAGKVLVRPEASPERQGETDG